MKTTVTYLTDTRVSLAINVDASELEKAEQVALTKLSKTVKVAGFREGKVPASVAAKHVDPRALQEETLDNALSRAVAEAFVSEQLQALDRPSVEVKTFVPNQELEFTAEVDVLPKITLGDYKKLGVKKKVEKVTDSEIDDAIQHMRTGMAEKTEVSRKAQDGDDVVIDFVGKRDGVAFDGGTAADYTLGLGSGQFIPGFEEGIVGHQSGEEFDVELSFPDDYHAADLAGTNVTFTVTLKKILESTLPELTDEFAAKAGPFKTVADLRADVKRELSEQKEKQAGEKFKDELITTLVEKSTVPVPDVLIADQSRSIEQDFERNLLYQGLNIDSYIATSDFKDKDDWLEKEVKPTALKRVQAGLVLAEVTKAEEILATEAEIDEHVETHKQQYANNPDVLQQFSTPEVRRDIANHFLTEKTIDALVDLNS